MFDSVKRFLNPVKQRDPVDDPDFGRLEFVPVVDLWHGSIRLPGNPDEVEVLFRCIDGPTDEQRVWFRGFQQYWRSWTSELAQQIDVADGPGPWKIASLEFLAAVQEAWG